MKKLGICYQCANGNHSRCYGDGQHTTCECGKLAHDLEAAKKKVVKEFQS
jgi:hypothetical protein